MGSLFEHSRSVLTRCAWSRSWASDGQSDGLPWEECCSCGLLCVVLHFILRVLMGARALPPRLQSLTELAAGLLGVQPADLEAPDRAAAMLPRLLLSPNEQVRGAHLALGTLYFRCSSCAAKSCPTRRGHAAAASPPASQQCDQHSAETCFVLAARHVACHPQHDLGSTWLNHVVHAYSTCCLHWALCAGAGAAAGALHSRGAGR